MEILQDCSPTLWWSSGWWQNQGAWFCVAFTALGINSTEWLFKGFDSTAWSEQKNWNSNVFGIKMLPCSLFKWWLNHQKHFRTKKCTEKRERWTSRPGKGCLHFFRPSPSSLCLISLLCCAFLEFQHWNCFWLLGFQPVLKSFDPRYRKLKQLLILYRSMTRLSVCNRMQTLCLEFWVKFAKALNRPGTMSMKTPNYHSRHMGGPRWPLPPGRPTGIENFFGVGAMDALKKLEIYMTDAKIEGTRSFESALPE